MGQSRKPRLELFVVDTVVGQGEQDRTIRQASRPQKGIR
jgi:hypothetical protein